MCPGTLNPEHFDEKEWNGRRKLRKGIIIPQLNMGVYSLLKEVVRVMSLPYIPS